jgi:hypothetical protein
VPEETDLVEGAPTSEAPAPTTSPAPDPTLSTSRIAPSTFPSEATGKVGIAYSGEHYGCNQYLYGNCTRGVKKNVTIYTPRRVGRVLWETK